MAWEEEIKTLDPHTNSYETLTIKLLSNIKVSTRIEETGNKVKFSVKIF